MQGDACASRLLRVWQRRRRKEGRRIGADSRAALLGSMEPARLRKGERGGSAAAPPGWPHAPAQITRAAAGYGSTHWALYVTLWENAPPCTSLPYGVRFSLNHNGLMSPPPSPPATAVSAPTAA